MRFAPITAGILGSLLLFACTSPTTSPSTAKTTGTMVVPRETDPAVAMVPMSGWQMASGYVIGLPAQAGTLDSSIVAQFSASIDGRAVPCTWDKIETASGDTRARFTLSNPSSANSAELIFRSSPSGTIKLATLVDRIDANASADLSTEVSARSTGALLVARAMATSGGKPVKSYTAVDFQAVANSPRTVEVETSLKTALSASNNKGQDTWTLPTVVAVTASVATDLGVSLKLGGNIKLGSGIAL